MKFRLNVRREREEALTKELARHGIGIDDSADLILSEADAGLTHLPVRDTRGERLHIPADSILFIESYGHDVDVHTTDGIYASQDRIYQLEQRLDPTEFLRVSQSVIVSRRHVKKIRPSLSMKFVLTLSDGTLVDVTRSYYSAFKDFFGI